MTDDDKVLVETLTTRMVMAEVGACSCGTKTHEWQYHDPACLYRILEEAIAAISADQSPQS